MEDQDPKYITYKYRWVVLGTITIIFIVNGFLWGYQVPFIALMATVYGLEMQTVNLINIMESIFFFPGTYILGAILNRYFSKYISILACSIFLALCGGFRVLINVSFAFCFISNAFKGLGSSLIFNLISKTTESWFNDEERSLATIIGMNGLIVGLVISFVMSSRMINPFESNESIKTQFMYSNLWAFIGSFVLLIICLIFYRSEPPTPPSMSATVQVKEENLLQDFKSTLKNKFLVIFIIAQSLFFAICNSHADGSAMYLSVFGYDPELMGNLFLCMTLCGVAGSFIFGFIMRKYKKFKLILIILSLITTISFGFILLSFNSQSGLYVAYSILGFAYGPFLAISQEYVCELGYPIPAGSLAGILNSFSMIIYLVGVILCGVILNSGQQVNSYGYIAGLTGFLILVSISVIIVPEKLRDEELTKVSTSPNLKINQSIISLNGGKTTSQSPPKEDVIPDIIPKSLLPINSPTISPSESPNHSPESQSIFKKGNINNKPS